MKHMRSPNDTTITPDGLEPVSREYHPWAQRPAHPDKPHVDPPKGWEAPWGILVCPVRPRVGRGVNVL